MAYRVQVQVSYLSLWQIDPFSIHANDPELNSAPTNQSIARYHSVRSQSHVAWTDELDRIQEAEHS